MYEGQGDHNAEEFSWYYGWDVLKRHWEYAVPDKSANILVPGIGNEPTLLGMFAGGWKRITARTAAQVPRDGSFLAWVQ